MKILMYLPVAFVIPSVYAQPTDSAKIKPTHSLSKFEQPSRFGASQPQTTTATAPLLNLPSPSSKRVKSEYQYENGRITGGKTTLFQTGRKKN